ncbi:MAG: hypothetical protein KDK78_03420, partial [Chlamydiia bacterium]|nr:hypothetical protein [Chlamydiia bacterium]
MVFSYLCWSVATPWLNDHMEYKRELLLLKTIMGHQDLAVGSEDVVPVLERHAERFAQLPESQRQSILDRYNELLRTPQKGWWAYTKLAFQRLAYDTPPFLQGYLLFSFVLCFAILFRVEGSTRATLLLPLVLLIYVANNQFYGKTAPAGPLEILIPSEETLVARYIPEGLAPEITTQFQQLKGAWEKYLIEDWAKESVPTETEPFQLAYERGEFAFNLAFEDALSVQKQAPRWGRGQEIKGHWMLQLLGLSWTLLFCGYVNRKSALDIV